MLIAHCSMLKQVITIQDIEKIQEIRKKLNLTQTELSKLAGVSQSLIAKLESGHIDPAYSKVKAIFEALDNQINKDQKRKLAKDIATKNVIFVTSSDLVEKVIKIMRTKAISQVPVKYGQNIIGSLSEDLFVDFAERKDNVAIKKVAEVMKESFPIVPETSEVEVVANLLHHYGAVLIKKDGNISGIITKSDLIKMIRN
ncbi:MAG: CBS domain-containing protein [Candidatus Micrarchaeota archaeon]